MTRTYAAVMTASPGSQLLLTVSLPAARATTHMRIQRATKTIGCAALRDGVYPLPARAEHTAQLDELADKTLQESGQARVLHMQATDAAKDATYRALFSRISDCAEWLTKLSEACKTLPDLPTAGRNRLLRRHAHAYEAIREIDFFSNEATVRAGVQWRDSAAATEATHSPSEPRAAAGSIPRRDPAQHQGRLWATRRHLWVDHVASAWLIQRFINPHARFLWLDSPADCPAEVLGFNSDGVTSTHVGEHVSFEVLIISFGLDDNPGLARLDAVVHALDVNDAAAPEAGGFEVILAGTCKRLADDGALLAEIDTVLDSLYVHFSNSRRTQPQSPIAGNA